MGSPSVPVLVVGGTSSGVGKTSVAVGIMSALRERGLAVQAFKVGPDFIDPLHHQRATGRPSINLDGWMLSQEQVVQSFHRHTADADIAVVEGVMGLFDGRDGHTDNGSTAQVAKWLGAPVLLVLDCSAMARSAAAVVKGYQEFDTHLKLGGVLLNKVGGAAHTKWLQDAMASAGLSLPVIGGLPKDPEVEVKERYLGLHLPDDAEGVPQHLLRSLTQLCQSHIDMEALILLARTADVPPPPPPHPAVAPSSAASTLAGAGGTAPARIAVAQDAAFCFYYQENLSLLREAGAELVFFSPLKDTLPPGVSGVYLGGGYPERYGEELSQNAALRAGLKAFARAGGVVYAECGGLVYLSRSVQPDADPALPMVGVFPFKTVMGKMTMAYVEVEVREGCPLLPEGLKARGHFHHHSQIVEEHVVGGVSQGKLGDRGYSTGYLARPQVPGAPELEEGFFRDLVLASYVHLHFGSCPQLAGALVAACCTVDISRTDLAVAAAVAEASAETAAGVPLLGTHAPPGASRESPLGVPGAGQGSPGCLASHPSPGLILENGYSQGRTRSLGAHREQLCREGGAHGLPASLDFSHQGAPLRHHSLNLPVGRLSPATTLAKVVSSGSLSNQSGTQYSSTDHHQLAAGELGTVSPLSSGSPSTSPREQDASVAAAPLACRAAVRGAEPPLVGPYSCSGTPSKCHNGLLDGVQQLTEGGEYHSFHVGCRGAGKAQQAQQQLPGSLPHSKSWLLAHGSSGAMAQPSHLVPPASGRRASTGGGSYSPSHLLHHRGPHAAQHHYQQQQQQPSRPRSLSLGCKPPGYVGPEHPQHMAQHAQQHPHGGGRLGSGLALGLLSPLRPTWQEPAQPRSEKIAALSPAAADILWALGLGGRVVAVGEGVDYPWEALPRARALRRCATSAAPLGGPAGSASAAALRSVSTDSLSSHAAPDHHLLGLGQAHSRSHQHLPLHHQHQGPRQQHPSLCACAAQGGWHVDEQVLARERPGLVVYEELGQPVQDQGQGQGLPQRTGSGRAAVEAVHPRGGPPAQVLMWNNPVARDPESHGSRGALQLARSESAEARGAAGAGGGGGGGAEAAAGGGEQRIGGALLEALVAVGLQQSCRVMCIQRRALSDIFDTMLKVGEAAGVDQEAVRAVDRLRSRLRFVAGQAALAGQRLQRRRPRVLLLRSALPLCTVGWWASDLVVLAGGEELGQVTGAPPRVITWGEIQACAPDVLVVASLQCTAAHPAAGVGEQEGCGLGGGGGSSRALQDVAELAACPGWWQLPAVKQGRVFVADHALLARPGPRLVEGVEALARMIYEDEVELQCPEKAVLKLSLRPGQRCRHRLLGNYFMPFE